MAATLDTLQIVKRLKEAGFDESQAEALTGVVRDLRDSDRSELATKNDIERLEKATKIDIERLESKLGADIGQLERKVESDTARLEAKIDLRAAELKTDIIRWVSGIAFAQAALILAVLRMFPSDHP
jgi:hypothetical protein